MWSYLEMICRIQRTRFRNQADFYSLFGAVAQLRRVWPLPTPGDTAARLFGFIGLVDDEARRQKFKPAEAYYAAARSASNDPGPRQTRINTIVQVISAPDFLPQAS